MTRAARTLIGAGSIGGRLGWAAKWGRTDESKRRERGERLSIPNSLLRADAFARPPAAIGRADERTGLVRTFHCPSSIGRGARPSPSAGARPRAQALPFFSLSLFSLLPH
jgi:hypothetical protein